MEPGVSGAIATLGETWAPLGKQAGQLVASEPGVTKVSRRDLPYVVARGLHGATTVAATMRLSALAGVRTFVTGGLGGAHRGAQQSFDLSADLTELAVTDVAVAFLAPRHDRQVEADHDTESGSGGEADESAAEQPELVLT